MSVLQCDRNGCENTMCDRLSDNYGYICNRCFTEFIHSGNISAAVFMKSDSTIRWSPEFIASMAEEEFPTLDEIHGHKG